LNGNLTPTFTTSFIIATPATNSPAAEVRAAGTNTTDFETSPTGGLGNFLGVRVHYGIGATASAARLATQTYLTNGGSTGYISAQYLLTELGSISPIAVSTTQYCVVQLDWETINTVSNTGTLKNADVTTHLINTGAKTVTIVTGYNPDNIWQGDSAVFGVTFNLGQ